LFFIWLNQYGPNLETAPEKNRKTTFPKYCKYEFWRSIMGKYAAENIQDKLAY